MIEVNNGNVKLCGSKIEIQSEAAILLRSLKETLNEHEYNMVIALAEMSKDELRAKSLETTMELFSILFGGKKEEEK